MSAIIAEWKRRGFKWNWDFKRSKTQFTIQSGREHIIVHLKGVEGVLYPSSAMFYFPIAPTSPDVGIRFKTDRYDSEWFFTATSLYNGGATSPNHSLYCPKFDPANRIYAIASDGHWPFEEELVFSLFNQSDKPVVVLGYAMWYAYVRRKGE